MLSYMKGAHMKKSGYVIVVEDMDGVKHFAGLGNAKSTKLVTEFPDAEIFASERLVSQRANAIKAQLVYFGSHAKVFIFAEYGHADESHKEVR